LKPAAKIVLRLRRRRRKKQHAHKGKNDQFQSEAQEARASAPQAETIQRANGNAKEPAIWRGVFRGFSLRRINSASREIHENFAKISGDIRCDACHTFQHRL
jgi:hypothetical protein